MRVFERAAAVTAALHVMIDIDRLTEAELIDLNPRAVARLRLLSQMRAHGQMLQCQMRDRVDSANHDQPRS